MWEAFALILVACPARRLETSTVSMDCRCSTHSALVSLTHALGTEIFVDGRLAALDRPLGIVGGTLVNVTVLDQPNLPAVDFSGLSAVDSLILSDNTALVSAAVVGSSVQLTNNRALQTLVFASTNQLSRLSLAGTSELRVLDLSALGSQFASLVLNATNVVSVTGLVGRVMSVVRVENNPVLVSFDEFDFAVGTNGGGSRQFLVFGNPLLQGVCRLRVEQQISSVGDNCAFERSCFQRQERCGQPCINQTKFPQSSCYAGLDSTCPIADHACEPNSIGITLPNATAATSARIYDRRFCVGLNFTVSPFEEQVGISCTATVFEFSPVGGPPHSRTQQSYSGRCTLRRDVRGGLLSFNLYGGTSLINVNAASGALSWGFAQCFQTFYVIGGADINNNIVLANARLFGTPLTTTLQPTTTLRATTLQPTTTLRATATTTTTVTTATTTATTNSPSPLTTTSTILATATTILATTSNSSALSTSAPSAMSSDSTADSTATLGDTIGVSDDSDALGLAPETLYTIIGAGGGGLLLLCAGLGVRCFCLGQRRAKAPVVANANTTPVSEYGRLTVASGSVPFSAGYSSISSPEFSSAREEAYVTLPGTAVSASTREESPYGFGALSADYT
jgi:hypothetical protein